MKRVKLELEIEVLRARAIFAKIEKRIVGIEFCSRETLVKWRIVRGRPFECFSLSLVDDAGYNLDDLNNFNLVL